MKIRWIKGKRRERLAGFFYAISKVAFAASMLTAMLYKDFPVTIFAGGAGIAVAALACGLALDGEDA